MVLYKFHRSKKLLFPVAVVTSSCSSVCYFLYINDVYSTVLRTVLILRELYFLTLSALESLLLIFLITLTTRHPIKEVIMFLCICYLFIWKYVLLCNNLLYKPLETTDIAQMS